MNRVVFGLAALMMAAAVTSCQPMVAYAQHSKIHGRQGNRQDPTHYGNDARAADMMRSAPRMSPSFHPRRSMGNLGLQDPRGPLSVVGPAPGYVRGAPGSYACLSPEWGPPFVQPVPQRENFFRQQTSGRYYWRNPGSGLYYPLRYAPQTTWLQR